MSDDPADLAIALAPRAARTALTSLFALDRRLGQTVASTQEPIVGQMRLIWWRDSLTRLDDAPAPNEPILRAVADHLIPRGIKGADLAAMTAGWEVLVAADSLDTSARARHAADRGACLFAIAARVLDTGEPQIAEAGRGWALADLAQHLSVPSDAEAARTESREALARAFAGRWARAARPLGILALLAGRETSDPSWRAVVAFLRFRTTGRC
jgi:phytoene synthase